MSTEDRWKHITVVGPDSVTVPNVEGLMNGDNQVFLFVQVLASRKKFVESYPEKPGFSFVTNIEDQGLLSVPLVGILASKGCDVFGYAAYAVVDPAAEVPESIPNRMVGDSVRTWQQWADFQNMPIVNRDGKQRVRLVDDGKAIPASLWAGLIGSHEIKSLAEVQTMSESEV